MNEQVIMNHVDQTEGSLLTYTVAGIGTIIGSVEAADVLVYLSILLALARLPIEIHRLYKFIKQKRGK